MWGGGGWAGSHGDGNAENLQLGDRNPVPPAAGGIRVRAGTGNQETQNFLFWIIPCEIVRTVRGWPDSLIRAPLDSMRLVRLADLQHKGFPSEEQSWVWEKSHNVKQIKLFSLALEVTQISEKSLRDSLS